MSTTDAVSIRLPVKGSAESHFSKNGRTRKYATVAGYNMRSKDKIRKGDFSSPLPYYHCRHVCRGHKTAITHDYTRYYYYPGNRLQTTTWTGDESFFPYNNTFFNPNDPKLAFHADFAKTDLKMLTRLHQRKMNIGVALGECLESARFLTGIVRDLTYGLIAIKKGKWKKGLYRLGITKDMLRSPTLSERWLATQFAVKPLMGDAYDAFQLHRKKLQDLDLFFVDASCSDTQKVEKNHDIFAKTSGAYPESIREHSFYEGSLRTRSKVRGRISDPELIAAKAMGLDNPYEIIWELTPFSFVIDWIIPIGDVIKAWQGTKGLSFVSGFRSAKLALSYNSIYSSSNLSQSGPQRTRYFYETYKKNHGTFLGYSRKIMTEFPVPRLYWKVDSLTAWHLGTSLALLNVLLSGNTARYY